MLVTPKLTYHFGAYYHFPLGLAYVSAAVKEAGHKVLVLNQNNNPETLLYQMETAFSSFEVDIVCTGGLTPNYTSIKNIFTSARLIKPDVLTICGGGLITSEPELIAELLDITAGVCGEGEVTIAALINAIAKGKDLKNIPDIVYKNSHGKYRSTKKRKTISNIDIIPFPDYDGFGIEGYLDRQAPNDSYATSPVDNPRMMPILGSRSCPLTCSFCFHPLGNNYRQRSLDNIFQEIDMLIAKYNVNGLMIYDELFATGNKLKRVRNFCERIKRRGIYWRVSLRVDCVDRRLLEKMRDSGCYYIGYGIENISSTVLKSMGKRICRNQIEKALALTKRAKIGVQGNLLFGEVAETRETIRKNIDWWMNNLQYQLHLVPIDTYPGSRLYKKAVENNKITKKVEFIEEGNYKINNSFLDDNEYYSLSEMLTSIQKDNLVFKADILKSECKGLDRYGRNISSYTVKCPHCNFIVEYNNIVNQEFTSYNIHPEYHKLACRSCFQRFDVPVLSKNLYGKISEGEVNT